MIGRAISLMALLLFGAVGAQAQTDRQNVTFVAGQVWSMDAPSPTTAKIIVGRVENWHGETIVHVSLVDLHPDHGPDHIDHMPFTMTALSRSVDRLLASGVEPAADFQRGYTQWKAADGGVFTITVGEALVAVNQTLRTGRAPEH